MDARRFRDQRAPIGRTRTENHADLPLLDDRVGLCAKPRVHQQVVHVAEPAGLSVDQVLALARSIQAARHFHFARERLDDFLKHHAGVRMGMAVAIAMAIAVPIAVAVRMHVRDLVAGVLSARLSCKDRRADRFENAGESQAHFGRGSRLAGVAAIENHVFHLVAAKALGALLAHHPGDGVSNVALPQPFRADNGGDAPCRRVPTDRKMT